MLHHFLFVTLFLKFGKSVSVVDFVLRFIGHHERVSERKLFLLEACSLPVPSASVISCFNLFLGMLA
jgi:hypothetical protein